MVGDDRSVQVETVERAINLGINWFDTAATYGQGESKRCLARALKAINAINHVHVATKVRVAPKQIDDIRHAVRVSFEASYNRLGVEQVTLLQLHNSVTKQRGDLPTSLSVADVLGHNGVVAEFEPLRSEGRVAHFGFTGLGDTDSLSTLIREGPFVAAQIPLNLLNPIAGCDATAGSVDVDYLQLAKNCLQTEIGMIGIHVLAGGALNRQDESPHTLKTKFFTLGLFERDRARTDALQAVLPTETSTAEASIRYVTQNLRASTALIGFAHPAQVEHAVCCSKVGPLEDAMRQPLTKLARQLTAQDL